MNKRQFYLIRAKFDVFAAIMSSAMSIILLMLKLRAMGLMFGAAAVFEVGAALVRYLLWRKASGGAA